MLGVLVAFVFSVVLLWILRREPITVLGIVPNRDRLNLFVLGMFFMAFCCTFNQLGQAYFKGIVYVRNPEYGLSEGSFALWWTFKAALFEELIFRGALLYLLMKWLGDRWACLISATAFGIYHWFSYQMFGRGVIPMAYVFLLTGAAGWMFAYAFAKSKSLLVPLGLHFGWIVMSIVVFSSGPLGDSLFVPDLDGQELGGWEQLFFFLFQTSAVPGTVCWFVMKRYRSDRTKID